MENAIEVNGLSHAYDGKKYALKDVSFYVERGEVMGVLGKNGAGKTTLTKILTTLLRPTSGSAKIMGYDLDHGYEIRKRIGVVQQEPSMDFTTAEGNLDVYGILWGVPKRERQLKKEALIKEFDLDDLLKKRFFDLSGGERRRVQIAREFMHDMDVLFLDEPTIGLDVVMRRSLLDFIRSKAKEGLAVMFTTHNLEEADYLCDRIILIDKGKVLAVDTAQNLKRTYGGMRTVELNVEGGSAPLYGELKALGLNASLNPDGSASVVTDEAETTVREVMKVARERGFQLSWLNVRESTLEEAFLNAVENAGRPSS